LTAIKLETAQPINNRQLGNAIASLQTKQKKAPGAKKKFNSVSDTNGYARQKLVTNRAQLREVLGIRKGRNFQD
jgi:hypothetical protein